MSGLYLYAFTRGAELPPIHGLGEAPVELLRHGPLAAVCSPFAGSRVRPSRRHLLAHDRTIRALMPLGVLPISFGTVAGGRASVEGLLERHGGDIAADLERLEGRVEMAVRARVEADNLFARYVAASPRLEAARDRLARAGATPDRDTMLAVGRLFADVLEEERAAVRQSFLAATAGRTQDVQVREPQREEQLFDLAFLLAADAVGGFEQDVEAVAADLADDVVIDLAGPLPPYSFSTLRLSFEIRDGRP